MTKKELLSIVEKRIVSYIKKNQGRLDNHLATLKKVCGKHQVWYAPFVAEMRGVADGRDMLWCKLSKYDLNDFEIVKQILIKHKYL